MSTSHQCKCVHGLVVGLGELLPIVSQGSPCAIVTRDVKKHITPNLHLVKHQSVTTNVSFTGTQGGKRSSPLPKDIPIHHGYCIENMQTYTKHYLCNRWCQINRSDIRDSGFIATSHQVPVDVGRQGKSGPSCKRE